VGLMPGGTAHKENFCSVPKIMVSREFVSEIGKISASTHYFTPNVPGVRLLAKNSVADAFLDQLVRRLHVQN
jgi:hypothetical protein